jgi:hypothetical protein
MTYIEKTNDTQEEKSAKKERKKQYRDRQKEYAQIATCKNTKKNR